jgi:hypothetical protein
MKRKEKHPRAALAQKTISDGASSSSSNLEPYHPGAYARASDFTDEGFFKI